MTLNLPKGMNEHYGRNVDKMPELLKVGEVPMSAARLMQERLTNGNNFPDLWNKYFDTSDLIVYPKRNSEDIYILLTINNKGRITKNGRKALELIKPDNLASNYGAVVEQVRELGRKGLIKVPRKRITTETYLTKDKVLNELTWRILARHPDEVPSEFAKDKNLLREYFKEVVSRTRNQKNMALYIGNSLKDKTTLKAWCVSWFEDRSDAYGWLNLDDDDGRLVGLAPEVLGAPDKNIGKAKVYSIEEILGESGNTNDFAPNQIRRLSNIFEQKGYQIHKRIK